MKRTRKGFTLIELLVVIGVIGILSAMTVMGGAEMNNIATANKIVRELNILSSAANMYYADDRVTAGALTADATGEAALIAAMKPYIKDAFVTNNVVATAEKAAGKYAVTIDANGWWLTYTLSASASDTEVGKILANKAKQESLKAAVAATPTDFVTGGTAVVMKVR